MPLIAGLSGRMIRKLPLLALSKLVRSSRPPFAFSDFIGALRAAVIEERKERETLKEATRQL